jgi:type II secretory pathway predicted ATPase ExeA
MENHLLDLLSELKSDKVTIRQKAVDKLTEILTNKLTQLQTLLDDNENVTWNDIFRSVALSIEANAYKIASGAEAHRNDKKIASFENLLLKVCESPAYGKLVISI